MSEKAMQRAQTYSTGRSDATEFSSQSCRASRVSAAASRPRKSPKVLLNHSSHRAQLDQKLNKSSILDRK